MDPDELLSDLDADQRAAVEADPGLVAVIAGAGSGKTRVLTRRIAHRMAVGTADPDHTLALTFTREAAGELRRRLRRLGHRDAVEAGTFHSVFLAVLRQRWEADARAPRTVTSDRRRLLSEVVGEGDRRRRTTVNEVDAEIAWAAAQGVDAGAYPERARRAGRRPRSGADRIGEWYRAYEQLKRRRGVIDFDDVLTMTLDEARRDASFADGLRWRFRHLHVDEAQDLNPVQHALVDLLRDGRDDLFLVGDPSQAIFGFNGADPALLVDVESRFAGIEVVRLPANHRCTPQVVQAGSHVLRVSDQRVRLHSIRPDGAPVELLTADDERDEATRIAHRIRRCDAALVRSSNIAVLARTHAQLTVIAEVLAGLGVPVRRTVAPRGGPLDVALRHATGQPGANALRGWAHDVLDDVDALEAARARAAASSSTAGRDTRSSARRAVSPADDALEMLEAERRVAAAALEFLRERPRSDGAGFRTWVATTSPFDGPDDDGGVELLTFHAAKGREWHTVIASGVETGLVPHKSATTAAARAEEARLLYVAMTRATDQLIVSSAGRRGGYQRRPSPLLEGFDGAAPSPAPPPAELAARGRPAPDRLLAALRTWREDAARRVGVLPVELCSDRDLSAMHRHRPGSVDDLVDVTSMGRLTAARLAPDLLPLLAGTPPDDGGASRG